MTIILLLQARLNFATHHISLFDHSFPAAGLVLSSTYAGHCTIHEQPLNAVNKEAAAELNDIRFYFKFCTGTAVDVGHVACTVGERERERERQL